MVFSRGRAVSSIVGVALAGFCVAGVRPLAADQDHTRAIAGQDIQVVFVQPQIPFKIPSLGGALLGAVGQFAVDRPAGAAVVERYGITDSALRVRDTFLADIAQDMSRVKTIQAFRDSDNISKLKTDLGSAGYALEFRSILTNVLPFMGDGKHQRIEYWVRARLIRLDSGSVVWRDTAKFLGNAPKGQRPTPDEMMANGAAVLKEKLNEAADACAHDLARNFRALK